MRAIFLVLLLAALVVGSTPDVDLDKVLEFTDLKLELIAKVKSDLIKHLASKTNHPGQKDLSMDDLLKKSVKKRAATVFSKLDVQSALPQYSDSVKSRVFEGVTIKVSQNASSFIRPLVTNTLLYKVNSTTPFGKNVILTCSGNVIQVIDLNGRLKAESVVNFRPDFIRPLGLPAASAGKKIESSFFVANSVGDYKEFTLEVFERKLPEKATQNTSAMNEGVPRLSTDSVEIEYTIIEKTNRNKPHPQTTNFTTSAAVYSPALTSHVFGLRNGEVWFRQRFDSKEIVVKVSDEPVVKLEENGKEMSVLFSTRRSIGSVTKGRITFECHLVRDQVVDFLTVKQNLVVLTRRNLLIYNLKSAEFCFDPVKIPLRKIVKTKIPFKKLAFTANTLILFPKKLQGKSVFLRADHLFAGTVQRKDSIAVMRLPNRIASLKDLGSSTIVDIDSHETEKEVWTTYLYLSDGSAITLASLNIITPKGEHGPSPPFSFNDLLDPKLLIMVVVAIVAIWFTSKKTTELNNQREKKEQESYAAKNKSKKNIDELSKRLDDMNKRFSGFS